MQPIVVRTVTIRLDETEYSDLIEQKGDRTWREVLRDGAEADT